uniref:Dystonin n=1 Tax=Esox lucius TaxID=8010 RepID=A0A3P8YZI6_ESOLU
MSSGSGNASLHCSMSSSADFSDEDDYSLKSGSVSPAPGDTLPWNLPRHERHKRKFQGGSVLDPAERAVLRIADERDRVQKKTFTKWINQHLLKVRKHINDLYEDLRDGHNLISLLEVLSGESLPREKGRMRFHRLQNVQIALDYLKRRQVKLVNIRNDDITDGNPKLTLGLIWTIILHFQISEIHVCGESEDMTAKERLLMWSQQMTEGYVGVRCDNFTTSWRDGRLFNAIIHKYRPDLVDMSRVSLQSSRSNLEQAFGVAERLGVAKLLDPEDVDVQSPDEKSVITYVSTLYDVFPKVPDGVDGISANDVDIRWVEYQNMVNYLGQWIKHNVAVMSDRTFPNNPVELKALYTQYLQFKENEIPLKENEKSKIKHLYQMLEVWIEFGRIQLPPGYHPNDVEKEWGKLIVAMLEREKSLRPEVDRLDMLQQIAARVQRDCATGEDKLALARTALQSDAKRLESGIQFQNEAEIAGYLLECENLLRQQVVDIQVLLDGKFYYSDQLVQRVSKLRDDLLGLRAECSSVYNQGRTLTTEQTKMMISGITQSLNSSFSSSNLTPALTPGCLGTPGPTFTSSLSPSLTPGLTPAMTPSGMQPGSVQAYMGGGGGGMDPGSLQHLKHMQIRKPMGKASLVDPNMTEEEVNLNFVQDLVNWVEEMQVQLDRGEWGSDLPSVETHLENHKGVHRAIEDFQMSLKEAKLSEIQMTQAQKQSYSEKLGKLENQYGKLLNYSRERQKNLESLRDFVSRATMELIWLNEKEEEEVAFDWSDRNSNISKKREYHADLMRELDDKEEVIKSVQDKAERLLQESHPARLTIEAYRAAMQTQWSWILQLCSCVEQHLKDNTVYFEFFNDAKESMDYLKSLQSDIQRKYGCDRTSSLHKLEDHIQESMDEKEQLLQYRSTVAGLVGKAKTIVQLKPRNSDTPVRSSIPVKAICDYRQIEITIYKDDECVLASNSHRAKWKVISPSGNEAMVPSVCFTVPPPNKEAVEQASRMEQLYQNVLALWHHSHVNMKSVVSWHYLMADIRAIRNWNVSSIKTMLPGEHQHVLSNLQSHFDDFLEDSEESEVFMVADCSQLEMEVLACKEYYEELLKAAEREEHEESVYNQYISEVRNFRMRLEAQEEHLIRQIRTPLDRDDLEQSVLRIREQEKKKAELDQLKEDLDTMKEKCETFLRQAAASPSVPVLSSDLNVLTQSMSQVYSMSSIYLEKLKTVSLVVKHSQRAEALVKLYEAKLSEEDAVNSELKSIDAVVSTLKQWRSEIDEQRDVFHDLEDGLQKARGISDRMFKAHNERDFDLDWHKEKADQLGERWNNVHSQIENRLRDLEGIGKSLKYFRESYSSLDEWVREMEAAQLKTQENQPEDSKALAELLNQQKVLVAEIEQKHGRIDECQKYSEQYSSGAKDYELQLMTYRAMVDSQHKSPLKRRKMQNSADAIIQEFMDLRTRYTALVTSMTQYVKFASETLKRTEGEERCVDEEKKKHGDKVSQLLGWISSVKPGQSKDGKATTDTSSKPQVSIEEMVTKKEQIAEALRTTQLLLTKHSDKMTEEEKHEAKEQLKSLQQAYSELSQHCAEQTPSADQVSYWTHGVWVTFIVLFKPLLTFEQGKATWKQLRELHEANECLLSPLFSSEPLPVMAAVRVGAIPERLAIKVLEIQLATGGLRVSHTGDVLSLDRAFQSGLIPSPLYIKLVERQNTQKVLINPSTAEKVSLAQMVQRSIVDPKTGRKLTVEDALSEDLIDEDTASGILSQQAQYGGIVDPQNGRRLTVEEAVQCGLISCRSALLVLEKQGLMGLLWPGSGEILTVSTSLLHEIINDQFAFKLLINRQKIAALYIPEDSEVVDIVSATQKGFIDTHTAEVLKTIEIPDVFPDVDELMESFSSWLMLREIQIGGLHRPTDHTKIDEENVKKPSPIEAKQLFISYLMMNSYMDRNSGQRLLILDGQLTKMAEHLVDISVKTSENKRPNTGLSSAIFGNSSLKEDMSEDSNISFEIETVNYGSLHIHEETDKTMMDHNASNFFRDESEYNQSDSKTFSDNLVKVLHQDGTELAAAIDFGTNSMRPDPEININENNTICENPITIETSGNQQKYDCIGSSATLTPPKPCLLNIPDIGLPFGAQDCKGIQAHDFTEELSCSDENTRQHDSDGIYQKNPSSSPFQICLETKDVALNNPPKEETDTQAMSEISTTHISSSLNCQKNKIIALGVTEEASVAVHSEDHDLYQNLYQKNRFGTRTLFEIDKGIPQDNLQTEMVSGVAVTPRILECSGPSILCLVNDTDMSLSPCAEDSNSVTAQGLTEESCFSSCKNISASPALNDINLAASEIAIETNLESLVFPKSCSVDSKKTNKPPESEASVLRDENKTTHNTSQVPVKIDVETSHIASGKPNEIFILNGGSATPAILNRESRPGPCSVNDTVMSLPLDVPENVSSESIYTRHPDSIYHKTTNKTAPFVFDLKPPALDNQIKETFTINEGSGTQTVLESSATPKLFLGNVEVSSQPAAQDSIRMPGLNEGSSSENNVQLKRREFAQGLADRLSTCIDSDHSTSHPASNVCVLTDKRDTICTSPVQFKIDSETDIASDNQESFNEDLEGADVSDLEKAETKAVEDIINMIQDNSQSHGGVCGDSEETDAACGVMKSSSPDLLRDLLKQESLCSGKTSPEEGKSAIKETLSCHVSQIQSQLLQILKSVSSSQDPAMLEDVIGTLSSFLGGASHEERPQNLEIIQEEGSSDEAEGVVVDPMGSPDLCQSTEAQSSSDKDDSECVGRLQDHADVLEEIKNNLSFQQGNISNSMEELHCQLEESQDMDSSLSGSYRKLEDTAFDIQLFISEHAQFLSPAQSSQLLKSLTATQRTFKEQKEKLANQRHTLERHLAIREEECQQKCMLEKQKELSDKLQELCDNLTNTENRLIGQEQQVKVAESVGDLQQVQQEHQALQKDVLTNGSALNEVISSTKKFLDENRSKLTPDQIAAIESKLEDAKSKAQLINQRAEESQKVLEKSVTAAIKQETEKVAAVEQLEESKNKIEGLLDWINNMGTEKGMEGDQTDHMGKQNGNLPLASDTSADNILAEDDDLNGNNGNIVQTTDNDSGREVTGEASEPDLDKQYDRIKARHQEILSQQQDLIMATQSAQALLDRQAHTLSPAEKDKLQRDIQELKGRYNMSLTQAEQQMKQVIQVQEELKKFQGDFEEFQGWLQQAESQAEDLGTPARALDVLTDKLQRQKSFSEDVISHKGDLRFITISGQKVLDVAKACGHMDPGRRDTQLEVDTTGTCAAVKEKLDSAASRYKTLHSQCNELGNNLKDVVDKYKKYEDSAAALLNWLNISEEEARRQQSEAIASDPQTLQKQLEDTKALQGQTTGRQTTVETLRKTADSLVTSEGDLLTNQDEIQETVDDIVERYDNLSKSVSDRNEKLQITLTRSLSVQDGLDEMMGWMDGVEEGVNDKGQVPLNSAAIGQALSKEAALEQDMSGRHGSISAMKAKVKRFVETADPAAAALLQSKMDALSQRFSEAQDKHKQKVGQLEQLKDKVEQFEKTSEKVQQFVLKRSQTLSETDGPGKNVNELSLLMQDTNKELAEHAKDVEMLQKLSMELSSMDPEGSKAQIQGKMDNLSNTFNAFRDTLKEKEEEVSSCQDQLGVFTAAAGALNTWLKETTEKVPEVQPTSSEESLAKDLQRVTALMDDWATKGSAVQDINAKGSALCSLISVLTSPAKTKITQKSAVTNGGNHVYLTNKELMVVQQNMSYINEGYESLGELLKARGAELSGLVQEVTEAQAETDAMMVWLRDMKKTAASWNSASTEKDAMKTQLEQQKAFEDEMKQKCEQLQKLREKLLHLIEKHPDSPEAANWNQMLAQIDGAWADINDLVEDRKQHLEESHRNLDVFHSIEPQLLQWLSEKELMLSVLGPLSMDPNMLNTQKQQVQILLKEFDSHKPQYDQINEAAAAILSTSDTQDPSSGGTRVKEQLAAITHKWQDLTGRLDQRAGLIDQAAEKTGQFQGLLRSLGQSAASLESRLNGLQALSSQPDVVKKQLEEANSISSQLRDERRRLKEAEGLCSELSTLVTEDYLKADLARQLEGITKPFRLLEGKAGKRIQQINSAFASSQQFHQTAEDFQGWMNEKLQEQSKPQVISAQVDTLRQSLKEHGSLQKVLGEHEEPYSNIIREGETLLQNTDGAEKVALQGQLAELRHNWDDVKKSLTERQEKLQGALQKAQKYHEHVEKLQSWVQECEARVGSIKLCVDPAEVEGSISSLKAIQKDVDKQRGLVEHLSTAAESLLEVANADTDAVRQEKAAITQSVDRLTEGLQNKRESLEKISQRLKEFNNTHKEAKGQLEGAKKQLEVNASSGVQAYSSKNLTNMKAQQKSLDLVNTQVEHLKCLAQGLVADLPEAEGVTDLLLQADSLEKEYSSLSRDVGETCSTLEGKLQGIGQFQTQIREMFTCFADLDDELDSLAPVGRDLATLKEQQGGIKGFMEKLQVLMADTARGGDSCKKMLETEASPDLLGLKRDLDALSKQCGKLMDRAKGRDEQVGTTLTRLEELYSKLQQFTNKLAGAEVKEESQGSVGMETDVINQQLEAFKVFQKEEVDPLQSQLQDISWLGQSLIQNAAKGTNIKGLEHDLEDVNTRWNTLNKKIAERSAQLHEALLHCGRFQDALESLLSWLTDTEELVSNQKPPSAEFKVVKAQIQEQIRIHVRFSLNSDTSRRPTVELIKKEGEKVAELGAESVDREKVGKEIECLGQRWDALLKKAENRHKQLKSILVVAQQFHDTLEPLSEWLSATEKCLANSEPIGTQTSKLEEQIAQHKALEEEIMGHSKDLVQAISLGQRLKTVSSVDDKELVQSKLDSAQAGYIELQERCRRKAEMLQQAIANAQLFGEDEVALMNWLNEVHTRLNEVSVEDYKTDVLERQCADQLALHEDIELRKQNVNQAISNGLELLKQTTGDEVVVIQGKLDGIKTRYAEINAMSDNVSKTLDQALALASKFKHTHEDLSTWLKNVEAELSAFAVQGPVGEQLIQAQDRQKGLLKEVRDRKPQVDKLNEVSSSLLELVPWRAREGLDQLVTEDNDRYKAATDTIAQNVAQIDAAILKSQQFEQAADTELAWLTEAERRMLSFGEIRLEQDQTTAQLQAQKGFSMDLLRHKDAMDDIVKSGEAIMNSKDEEEKQALKTKIQALLEKYGAVSQLNSERCLQLERAQSLASQFWETYEELWPWLQETRASFSQLPLLAIEYEALRQQQEELRQMRELIAEHKPHIDKMNKTGPQLLELSPGEGVAIREKYSATDQLYTQLKADVKHRAATLDEAISKSTQFHDKIEPMLESLGRIAERLRQPPSISVEVEKIREQLTENKAVSVDLEKLQPSYDTLKQRGEEMIARSAGTDKDLSAKAVQDKLDQMVFTWNEIHSLMEEREAKLLDVMDLADKFWCDHSALIVTIKDTQDLLRELEEPGVDPSVVKQQQECLEGYKEEIDGLQEELDVVRTLGVELMAACGEPDKPVIKKSIDEVNSAWETLNKGWKDRVDRLDDAMQAAVQFQDSLQGMFDWVDIVENKLDSMSPVGTDLETVKQQIEELKEFKGEAYQLQIEMERLNHQAGLLLKKVTEEYDRCAIQEPMTELKMLWDNLDEKIINRQHKLEGALLALGQFQHALDELLAWMSNTEELLNEQRKAAGDPKAIEIELAKHHVLQNDVLAHKTTVEVVNKAGTDLVESTSGEEASGLQSKLESLTQRWKSILEKTEQRRHQLDSALLQAQGFHGEIEDMQHWLKDTERQLLASKAVGGLPDTAREQLNAHLELCSAFEAKEELYQQLIDKGQQLLTLTPTGQDSNTEQDLRNLQDKWELVQTKVADRKVKLEEALALATDFHNSLQDFINWLTQAEQTLTMSSPASLILETVMFQIDEHKVFVTEVNSHREQIIELDKTGTHLKYFSQKQDVVLIKNLLISVQGRWESVVQRSVERGRLLDDARKRSKQFHETWNKLTEWLDESEKALDSELEIANDPDKIKTQLAQHKEFQKALGSKHSVYDTTSRTGRALKDKTSLQDDNQKLEGMLSELRDKWDTVCGKSVERQNKLEEALLFSGQFTDALQALIDWLYRVEPQLAEDQPVHGDIDLVLNLIDSHKVFQKELGKRTGSVAALKRSAKELIEGSREDSSWVKAQMQDLSSRWETVCARSVSKQTRLEQALCQAEEFHSTVHILLEWLAEAEQSLRFHGTLPDDEEALRALIEQHKEFMKKQEEKRVGLNKATSMGEAILTICHPDSITTIKHWNTIIKARFEEVQAWSRQHQQRLAVALCDLLATQELLEGLLGWLQWAETTLNEKDQEVLPQDIDEVKALIAEHQTFMEEMTRKQPDVDKITKTHKRKAVGGSEPAIQSQIPVLEKGRGGRKRSPTQGMYPSATQSPIETKNPRVNLLVSKWQQVWLLALDRRRKLNDAMDRLEELKEFANFDFDVWRKRYMRWMNHKKSRVMDFFRRIDKDQDGKVTRQEFIEGILSSKFPTSRLEMSAVADIFDRDGDGYIDYYEFVAALHPNKEAYKPLTDADKIEDEVTRQVAKCKCPKRFQVEQIGANKYRFYLGNQFGDSQQLRLVRILRSTVMVRVGGGWMALDEFLVKNDPCRAKGRTNMELREKFILPEGTTQVMASFRYRGRRSRPSSRAASPNRSNSSQSCPAQHNNPALPSTPKTPQHITRNYDKPWLTNSKPSTPLKSSDSFESQGSSSESTPIQGSKLRLPGYLSGKGFQSGEDQGTLINAAVMKARGQAIGYGKRTSSRPGSKTGSRVSSRRGSDASDFDISDIASVCSDTSETVGDTSRATPRSSSRQHGGKPSKIPTPQRRSTPSKLAKTSKR